MAPLPFPPLPSLYRPPTVGRPGFNPYVFPSPGYEPPVPPARPPGPLFPSESQHIINQMPGMTQAQLHAAIQHLSRMYFGNSWFPRQKGEMAPPLSGQQWGPSNWTLLLRSALNPSAHVGWSTRPTGGAGDYYPVGPPSGHLGTSSPNYLPYPRPRTRT